jgi:hypothetical protein
MSGDDDASLISAMRDRIARLEGELGDLKQANSKYLELVEHDPKIAAAEARSSSFWFAMWRDARRKHRVDGRRIIDLQREVSALRCGDLVAYADGELEPERSAAFRLHLPGCRECRRGLIANAQLDARIAQLATPRLPKKERGHG